MPRCYDCGANTENIVRRTVKTGHSWGARGKRTYHHKVNLCSDCARSRYITKLLIFVGVVVFLIIMSLREKEVSENNSVKPKVPESRHQKPSSR